jgi:hypothetical protein
VEEERGEKRDERKIEMANGKWQIMPPSPREVSPQ